MRAVLALVFISFALTSCGLDQGLDRGYIISHKQVDEDIPQKEMSE